MQIDTGDITPIISTPMHSRMLDSIFFWFVSVIQNLSVLISFIVSASFFSSTTLVLCSA